MANQGEERKHMPPMMRDSERRTLPENIRPQMAKAQTVSKTVELSTDALNTVEMLSLIDTARRRADLKLEYLAAEAGVAVSTLSGALNGHGGLNVCWLWTWPSEFWNEFLPLLRANKESSAEARRAQRKERLIKAIEVLLTEVA